MPINLKAIQPHKVSKDLSGYITYIYGPGGAGKTTFGVATEKPLLLAFEKGYNALPGVYPLDITTWGEMKQVLRQLDDPEVKDMFKTIIIDTVDIASQLCEKYICSQLGIENIGDGGWTVNGWSKVKKEWESTFRAITMKGYAVVFISHSKDKTFKRKDGTEYNQTVPSCSTAYNEIIKNMSDIEGYINIQDGIRTLILRSADDSVECKCRFSQIASEIPFSYQSLVDALYEAIEKEAKITNGAYVTEEREKIVDAPTYDYDSLMSEFETLISSLMSENQMYYTPRITEIIDKYLGKGKKVSDATRDQAELIYLIVDEIKTTLIQK